MIFFLSFIGQSSPKVLSCVGNPVFFIIIFMFRVEYCTGEVCKAMNVSPDHDRIQIGGLIPFTQYKVTYCNIYSISLYSPLFM